MPPPLPVGGQQTSQLGCGDQLAEIIGIRHVAEDIAILDGGSDAEMHASHATRIAQGIRVRAELDFRVGPRSFRLKSSSLGNHRPRSFPCR